MSYRLICVLAALWGCAGSGPPEGSSIPERRVYVEVVNNNWLDARVYLTTGATTRSLGLITTNNEGRFRIPVEFVGRNDVQLVANVVGSRLSFRTEKLPIVAGQTIVLTLEEPLDRSWITVR